MNLKHCIQRVVRDWNHRVVGTALAVVLGTACGGSMGAEPSEEHGSQLQEPNESGDTGEVHAAICSYGYWRCPTTNEYFEYESLACSHNYQFSKPKMKAVCTSHCPTTCLDSGWQSE